MRYFIKISADCPHRRDADYFKPSWNPRCHAARGLLFHHRKRI